MAFKIFNNNKLQLIHIGGMAEIGKNLTVLRYGNNIMIIDCGMKFPDDDMHGIDKVIPDMSFLIKNKSIIRGLVLTHGHEDHIGAIQYLLKEVNVPIYGTRLTLGIVEEKLKEAKLAKQPKFHIVKPKDVVNLGPFKVQFIRVCHSIADAVGLAINTPAGVIIHTGDFKIDYTPVDKEKADLNRFAELGRQGVLLLMSDSTNADTEGCTQSETIVGKTFERIFSKAKGRILVAQFATNIHRIQQVLDTAAMFHRKVAISGLSMQRITNKSKELGYLNVPKDIIVKLDEVHKIPHRSTVIITTGSQGEPMAALSRMARGEHKQIKIQKGDTVIISATPIPGNEKSVNNTVNSLFRLGADVVYEERQGIHVSGHACQDEMKILLDLVKPKFFVPVHGEYRHMVAHAKLAKETGIKPEHIFINENGDTLNISKDRVTRGPRIPVNDVLIEGNNVADVGARALNERRQMADNGLIVLDIFVSRSDLKLMREVEIETRGFIFLTANTELVRKIKDITAGVMKRYFRRKVRNLAPVRQEIQKEVGRLLQKKTDRRPVIVPLIAQL